MKKRNLAVFAVILSTLVIGFFSLMTSGTNAQKSASDKTDQPKCFGKYVMPSSISVNNEAFANFIKVASLPMKQRRETFSKQSNEQKANYIKTNLALQFIKRPNMTSDQKALVLDMMSKVSADIYDKSDPEKAKQVEADFMAMVNRVLGLFPMKEAGDFIEPMQTDKIVEVALLQKYEDLLKNGNIARKSIAKEMPVNDRVNIWKVQMAYHLVTGKFTRVQNEAILNFLSFLTAETFLSRANLTKEEVSKINDELESNLLSIFTREEVFGVFMAIGIQKNVKDKVEENLAYPYCNCYWYCSGDPECQATHCITGIDNCGVMGGSLCTAKCR
jgi:hypothetical protein